MIDDETNKRVHVPESDGVGDEATSESIAAEDMEWESEEEGGNDDVNEGF